MSDMNLLSSSSSSSSSSPSLSLIDSITSSVVGYKFNGDPKHFPMWKLDVTVAFDAAGYTLQLTEAYSLNVHSGRKSFAPKSDRIETDAEITAREQKQADRDARIAKLTAAEKLSYSKGFALLWSTLGPVVKQLFAASTKPGDTFELYSAICKKFETLTTLDVTRLQKQMITAKLGPNEDIDTFISRFKIIAEQLSDAGQPYSENQLRFFICEALPSEYSLYVDMLDLVGEKSIDELVVQLRKFQFKLRQQNLVAQHEKHAAHHVPSSSSSSSSRPHQHRNNNNNNNNKNSSSNQSNQHNNNTNTNSNTKRFMCFRCGKSGHTITDCNYSADQFNCNVTGCSTPNGHNHTAHKARADYDLQKQNKGKGHGKGKSGNNNNNNNQSQQISLLCSNNMESILSITAAYALACGIDLVNELLFILDSGATKNLTPHGHLISHKSKTDTLNFGTAAGSEQIYSSDTVGTCHVELTNGDDLSISNMHHVPGLAVNLLSVKQLKSMGTHVDFPVDKPYAVLKTKSGQIIHVPEVGDLFILRCKSPATPSPPPSSSSSLVVTEMLGAQPTFSSTIISSPSTSTSTASTASNIVEKHVVQPTFKKSVAQPISVVPEICVAQPTVESITATSIPEICVAQLTICVAQPTSSSSEIWHYRLGHVSTSGIQNMIDHQAVTGMNISSSAFKAQCSATSIKCTPCAIAKAKKASFASSKLSHVTSIMGRIDADLCGPIKNSENGETGYILSMIDVYSRMIFVHIISLKSDAEDVIMKFILLHENQTGKKLKIFHSDGGGEFMSKKFKSFLDERGILKTTTATETPQQNPLPERANRTIFEMARALLLHAGLPNIFWPEAALTAAYLRNRCTTKGSVIQNKTPYETWFGRVPSVDNLIIFGSDCFIYDNHPVNGKLSGRSSKGIFVGYDELKGDHRSYKCYDISTLKISVTRNVTFNENVFTHAKQLKLDHDMDYCDFTDSSLFSSVLFDNETELAKIISLESVAQPTSSNSNSEISVAQPINSEIQVAQPTSSSSTSSLPVSTEQNTTTKKVRFQTINLDNVIHSKRRPIVTKFYGLVNQKEIVGSLNFTTDNENEKSVAQPTFINQNKNYVAQPTSTNTNKNNFSVAQPTFSGAHLVYTSSGAHLVTDDEMSTDAFQLALSMNECIGVYDPNNYREAMSSKHHVRWTAAMQSEFDSLIENGTWELVDLPKGKHVMGCRWVYKIKLLPDGSIDKFKARLCAQGFSQQEHEYGKTYAPVMGYISLRLLLSIATALDYELKQKDVCTAFLNADVQEEIYMKQPEGFSTNDGKVCRLVKTLYGLKQSPYEWNKLLDTFLVSVGWTATVSDPCIYFKISKTNKTMFLGVFVDDIVSGYLKCDEIEYNQFKSQFMKRFKTSDMGDVCWILGMKVERDRVKRTLFLHQKLYIDKVLSTFKMNDCKSVFTPEDASIKLSQYNSPLVTDIDYAETMATMKKIPYAEVVGSLLYAGITTRPDIAHCVHVLTRYMQNPAIIHWEYAKRCLRYLKGTSEYGLLFTANNQSIVASATSHATYVAQPTFTSDKMYVAQPTITSPSLITSGMSDANYGGDSESLIGNVDRDYKSMMGSAIYVAGNLIDWSSSKEPIVAQSSCESEYMAARSTANKMIWVKSLLSELKFPQSSPSILYCDNQAAISVAQSTYTSRKLKHVAIPWHVLKDYVKNGAIDLKWIDTKSQLADIFTKPLTRELFIPLRDKLVFKSSSLE